MRPLPVSTSGHSFVRPNLGWGDPFNVKLLETNEFWMIWAHCLLTGLDVGAVSVMEKYGAAAAFAIGTGTTENTSMKAKSPRRIPLAVSSNCAFRNCFRA
jgi:hypothetical protein